MAIFQKPFGVGDEAGSSRQPDTAIGGVKYITERHVACVFLLDTSGSMYENNAIGQLNAGLEAFKRQTLQNATLDEHTKACIDVALVTFGPTVQVVQDFTPVSDMILPQLTADGGTPMGDAINTALDMIAAQKAKYNELGTPYYRPWIFCITDGEPNSGYEAAAARLRQMEEATKVVGFCVGVQGFNQQLMAQVFNRDRVYVLDNLNFTSLFEWLSSSIAAVRESNPDSGRVVAVEAPKDLHMIQLPF